MAVRKRFLNPFPGNESARTQCTANPDGETPVDSKLPLHHLNEGGKSTPGEEIVDENAQSGTQKAQASTQAWTRNTLIAAYIL